MQDDPIMTPQELMKEYKLSHDTIYPVLRRIYAMNPRPAGIIKLKAGRGHWRCRRSTFEKNA